MNILKYFRPDLNNEKKALINIGYTISDLADIFDKSLTNKIYLSLTDEQKKK